MQLRPTVFAAVPQIYDRFADGIRTVSTPEHPRVPPSTPLSAVSAFFCARVPP